MAAARQMRMGSVSRVTMVFQKRIWPEEMSFLMAREAVPSVWWSARPAESLTLTGWVGGPKADQLLGLGEKELRARTIAALAVALGIEEDAVRREVAGFYTHYWNADESARGAYSWVPVGGRRLRRRCASRSEILFTSLGSTPTRPDIGAPSTPPCEAGSAPRGRFWTRNCLSQKVAASTTVQLCEDFRVPRYRPNYLVLNILDTLGGEGGVAGPNSRSTTRSPSSVVEIAPSNCASSAAVNIALNPGPGRYPAAIRSPPVTRAAGRDSTGSSRS